MKLDSKYFDTIRVKRRGAGGAKAKPQTPECAWEGCDKPGLHKAPMGRDHEGEYLNFCVDHVRQYNKSYNYFSGLGDDDIRKYLKDSLTGHRPTWSMGHNASSPNAARNRRRKRGEPFDWAGSDGDAAQGRTAARRRVRPLEQKALETMNLQTNATGEDVRLRYKELVKQLHPDANGGDRGHEDRLRDVIQAYKLLKQSGFC
ncbi:Heat shock protein DnaJ [Fulvimarina pelagi HTCC2506]|uniref:Heat shock protein DnaJ n=1 Tax=Fulvimarina pelagi HTCC2506 TaxID=314231 RepID=Q0G2E0_9HYPH|nr:DnaJ domain-containing protein [Fulvimarina pelagi]EAU41258.1 Heat shock protein DnaJ [Fulvimarina pelagi HTCC2506]